MFSSTSVLHIIFIFLVTFSLAYIFGLILVRMMDKKLDSININISPQLENIIKEGFTNKPKEKTEVIQYQQIEAKEKDNGSVEFRDITNISEKEKKLITRFDNEYFENMTDYNKIDSFSKSPNHESVTWSPSKTSSNVCYKNHQHSKDRSNGCSYGPTNYSDPFDMSPIDYNIFVLNYPPNLTLQDYINWLWCYKDKKDQLPYNHLRNLEKLELGKELKEEPGVCPPPGYYFPPMNSEDYFNKLYNENNEFNIAAPLNSVTGPMLGYNFDNYSEFTQNQDVWGLSGELRNPDIGKKFTAREVDDYIIPHDSENLEIEKAFKPYHVKQIEI